jgi:hypothetical protein
MKSALLKGFAVVSLLCAAAVAVNAQKGKPETLEAAAREFLSTLDTGQKSRATFPFSSDERLNWHFIPRERKGLPLKDMNPAQQQAALNLLKVSLSETGYNKAATIRELEKILKAVEMGKGPTRDPINYYFSVFGEPTPTGTWGWRYEGHHCAQNWTVVKGRAVASSPQFFGSNPAEVRVDVVGAPPKGTKVLRGEEEKARLLLNALTEDQKKQAILSPTAPNDIITGAQRQAAIQEDKGIAYKDLSKEQQRMLVSVIREYTDAQAKPLAEERLAKIRKAGMDGIKFAWMGSTEVNQGHYYRVQGSTFLIEYDNTQNNANHVHAVWRDFKGDFGMDLLAMHYQAYPHRYARAK